MATKILIDSSFLRLLFDKNHPRFAEVSRAAQEPGLIGVVPQVVLTEAAFLFRRDGGVNAVIAFLDALRIASIELEPVTLDDISHARQIMAEYTDAKLDFVDCCIVALAERLNITRVATLDRRDFSIIRTKDGKFLDIVP